MKTPDKDEIQDMRDKAANACHKGSKYPGMSYEEGLRDALEWVLGDAEEKPL